MADVNGFPIWFESEDTVLVPSAEGFANAFLVAGLLRESQLILKNPLNPVWQNGISMLLDILNEWWGLPLLLPQAPPIFPTTKSDKNVAAGTALLFSGGVDSFYSLLRGRFRPEQLVFVWGYDIPLEDKLRMDAFYKTFLETAATMKVKPVLIKTNLRKHALVEARFWMQIHGGALTAIGHLMSGMVGDLMISSTHPYSMNMPWGSHWRIDELWSSANLHVTHVGAEHARSDKLREIASEPVVQKHLRVCLENNSPTGNCSRCEKCLRTMLVLFQCGKLDQFQEVFDLSEPLEKRFETVKPPMKTMPTLLKVYEDVLNRGVPLSLDQAVRGFIKRYDVMKKTREGRVKRLLGSTLTNWIRTQVYEMNQQTNHGRLRQILGPQIVSWLRTRIYDN